MKRIAILMLLLATSATAFAQTEEDTNRATKDERRGDDTAKEPDDPTEHFNWASWSYRGKDEYGGTLGDGHEGPAGHETYVEEPMSPPFVLALVNFAVFLFILAKYGGPFANKFSAERHDEIKNALDEAARLRDEAKTKLADYDKRIKDVDREIGKLVDGIRADAEADKVRILAAAEAQAAQMKRDAELHIAAEIEFARAKLANEVSFAATAATEKLLRDNLQPSDQERLVSSFIGGLS